MKKSGIPALLMAIVCAASVLAGCGGKTVNEAGSKTEHEPITIQSPFRNLGAFIKVVNEKYPEINLEVIPYSGANMTAYMTNQLKAGDMTDIYFTTVYSPGLDDLSDKLIDLSGYDFTNNYSEVHLRSVSDNGAIYLLPTYFTCLGITYNKTLLEKNGWELPGSLEELEELVPKVEAAGCNLALCQIALPGYGFQYLCNILDTDFLNTIEGRKWQNDFLNGTATVEDTPALMESFSLLERWKRLGMLEGGDGNADSNTRKEMAKGNTLFMLGSSNTFTEDETTDEFGLMPYLSEDGTQNALILNVSRYVGLNKHLTDLGNEQKLEDAIHVIELLSTTEGMKSLNDMYTDTSLLPLRDYEIPETSYYKQVEGELNKGLTAPFIYSGWENVIVPVGNAMISYIKGEKNLDYVISTIDDNKGNVKDSRDMGYTIVTEKIDTDNCARLVGICFAKAAGADLALISKNKWYDLEGNKDLNLNGVSGALFALPVTDQEITSILPTGWRGNIYTVTLSGKRIKELAETGFDRNGDGNTFPYETVMPEGMVLEDNKTYTTVICGVTDEVAKEGNLTDTGILGLAAAQEYFSGFDTFSNKDIIWE